MVVHCEAGTRLASEAEFVRMGVMTCTGAPLRGGYPPPVAATLVWGGTPPNLDSSGAAAFKGGGTPPSHHQSLLLLRGGHLPLALREALLWRRPGREHLRFRTDELLLLRGG